MKTARQILEERAPYIDEGHVINAMEAYAEQLINNSAINLIIKERQRQVDVYGYTDEHILNSPEDYGNGELASAAASYALDYLHRDYDGTTGAPVTFPWPDDYWKPTPADRVRELVKAGALIVEEIIRLTT